MQEALYGPNGFYVRNAPEAHFRTSVTASPLFAAAVHRLAAAVDDQLGRPPAFDVVDVGAGNGSLLGGLAASLDDDERHRWRLLGVDLRERPPGVPDLVAWSGELPSTVTGVVVAHELLDNVPVDVVELTEHGLRRVEVHDDGSERATGVLSDEDVEWLARWWPMEAAEPGDRAEPGHPRDAVWADLVGRLAHGVAVAVDYAHSLEQRVAGSWAAGTLTGYRDGHQTPPVPDGSCDLTAHVALDACEQAGLRGGATGSLLTDQRTALGRLGVGAPRPPLALAHADPVGYVVALSRASQAAELLQTGGLGDFGWLVQAKGCPLPEALRAH
jgi:SAM-dependent MidA family methyltransferase